MKDWHRRFFSNTRSEIIQLLRRTEASARDLAEELDLTTNAIRSHLTRLERDRLVEAAGKRAGVRKPETLYTLTPEAETLFPKAYHLLLDYILEGLKRRLPDDQVHALLEEVGRAIGAGNPTFERAGNLQERVKRAMNTLEELGGLAELEDTNGSYVIRGQSCPLAAVTSRHPEVCHIAQTLLEEITQATVQEMCERDKPPKCVFHISKR